MIVINIGEDVSGFIKAKSAVEAALIESKQIDSEMSVIDFVEWLDMKDNVVVSKDKVIPYKIVDAGQERYLFVSVEEASDILICQSALSSIDYDTTKLIKFDPYQYMVAGKEIDDLEYFLINGEYLIKKEKN